ncbi:MAG: S9 family peptidase, partial [Alphaproteobacteria bacterium]|nr:S9 family peptidase [Alphaproteobacteria bacterium]
MAGLIAGALAAASLVCAKGTSVDDPYLWLEEVHGAKPLAWVADENRKSLAELKSDPRYQEHYDSILKLLDATDRIPFGALDHSWVFNFWQDAQHPKGIWRRTSIESYARAEPDWEILIDLDRLAAAEKENWVWKGAECTPSLARCLVSLSRGGGDAIVVREFDPDARAFVAGGFQLAEAKSSVTWLDEDRVLFGTDFGKGSLTTSGYPSIVKLWQRGESIADAKTLYQGQHEDVATQGLALEDRGRRLGFIVRAIGFFESIYSYLKPDGTLAAVPLPRTAVLQGVHQGQVLVTLREDWKTPDGTPLAKGTLFSFPLDRFLHDGSLPRPAILYVPDARASIEQVMTGRDGVYASIYENVTGAIVRFAFDARTQSWSNTALALPSGGSTHIVSVNDFGPEAQFTHESFLEPTTLYESDGGAAPKKLKALP